MNRIALLTLALAVAGASTAAFAQADRHDAGHDRDGRHAMHKHGKSHARHGGIAALDKDQDGRIARAELQGEGRHLAMWTQHFDKVDANRDGFLVRAELEAWRQAHRAERQAQRAAKHAQRFTEADLNKDGRLSKVEASEKMPRLVRNFAWMDDNRDGFLSREELRPMRAR